MSNNFEDLSAGIRDCSFVQEMNRHPGKYLLTVRYVNGPGQPDTVEAYLPVKNRKLWFHKYLQEMHKSGLLDDSQVVFEPSSRTWVATAKVYIDDQLVGISSAGAAVSGDGVNQTAVQNACTRALGRALSNAGFGTSNLNPSEEGNAFPCDSGLTITQGSEESAYIAPLAFVPQPMPQTAAPEPYAVQYPAQGSILPMPTPIPTAPAAPVQTPQIPTEPTEVSPAPAPAEVKPAEAPQTAEKAEKQTKPRTRRKAKAEDAAPAAKQPSIAPQVTAATAMPQAAAPTAAVIPTDIESAWNTVITSGRYQGKTFREARDDWKANRPSSPPPEDLFTSELTKVMNPAEYTAATFIRANLLAN